MKRVSSFHAFFVVFICKKDLNEDDEHELINEKDVHYFIGISKEDTKLLIQEHPDIPHVLINNKVYYPKAKLRKWLKFRGVIKSPINE